MPTAAANPLLTVEQRLWTLALAWPALIQVVSPRTVPLLKPGNVERFDQLGILWPKVKPVYQAADSVTFTLDVGQSRPDPKGPRTFCLQPVIDQVDFTWTLAAPDRRLNDVTQAAAELRACMVAAGTQLGITATVAKWEWAMRPGKPQGKDRQMIITMTVTVKG